MSCGEMKLAREGEVGVKREKRGENVRRMSGRGVGRALRPWEGVGRASN